MGRRKTVPSPSCPSGHGEARVIAWGSRELPEGRVQRFKCSPRATDGFLAHVFDVLVEPANKTEALLNEAIPPPKCPLHKDANSVIVVRRGVYQTAGGERQRYECRSIATGAKHTFSAVLPRAQVTGGVCCDECKIPTPANAGKEVAARKVTYPASVVHLVLKDLSEGRSYTATSLRALEVTNRPTGRTRKSASKAVATPTPTSASKKKRKSPTGPVRDGRAHWHISADILEAFGPLIAEQSFATIDRENAGFREQGLPIVYMADDLDVKRTYSRSKRYTMSPSVWAMLVVSRTRWEKQGTVVNRSNRLSRVRALPNRTQSAWELVFSELAAPDFLVCDGASAISNAAAGVWGETTTIVPCIYHALVNIEKHITPAGIVLPSKVYDELKALTREALRVRGPKMIGEWFDGLEIVLDASDLPVDALWNLRSYYQPLLEVSARVAHDYNDPMIPISNAGAEFLIDRWVKPVVERRGPMFTNLPRTNLLGDLIVAGSNGALLNARTVADAIQDDNRAHDGWAPPVRVLAEPKGALGLRDPRVIDMLRDRASA